MTIGPLVGNFLFKTVIALAVLLVISVTFNVRQYRAGAIADTACKAQAQQAVDTGVIDSLERAARQSRDIAEEAILERDRIAEAMRVINADNARLQYEYEMQLAMIPPLPPVCAPGQDRVDAFNRRD